jgi:RHS repeat-associated protein
LYNTADLLSRDSANASTYYSYDILGNVDTLVQDYNIGSMGVNGNRFKKIVYDFDLFSGKVNQVTYQPGYADAFYHSYLYDAENRVTNVQSSTDGVNWDNDAFYSYYAHGLLARTVLGQQQVQGINYAYNLQGWLKAINPTPYTGGSFTLRPDSSNNIVAAAAYNLLLNYHDGDYSPISGVAGPDSAISTTLSGDYRPLFNGNISSMGVNIGKLGNPLVYNYQYDQLNRLVHMDAWKRTSTPWSAITKLPDYQESIAYDPNGNIQKYKRNGNTAFGGSSLDMDNMVYSYVSGTNKLDHINDSVSSSNYTTDIDDQSSGNYKYDSIGQLISDDASNISNISWTVYGKIASIAKSGDTTILFTYDAGGNRISKSVVHAGDTLTTWYVRDAQGNVLSVYTYGDAAVKGKDLTQTELHVYGSSRLGILKTAVDVEGAPAVTSSPLPPLGTIDSLIFTRGNKLFELTNHLGNVLATISDKRYGVSTDDSTVTYFIPEVVSANDYYPFGSLQPNRSYTESGVDSYRYGFNGQEKSDEIKGPGNSYTAEFWEYDPRIGRRWNLDPKPIPAISLYAVLNSNPIWHVDPRGDSSVIDNKGYVMHYDAKDKDLRVFMNSNGKQMLVGELGKTIDANGWFGNLLNENMSNTLILPWTFKNYVKKNGRWDYKNLNVSNKRVQNGELKQHILGIAFYRKDKETNPPADLADTKFLFSGETGRAEDWNNYHFGVVGKAFWLFDEQTLLKQAGAAEMGKWAEEGKVVPSSWRPIQQVVTETYTHGDGAGGTKITVDILLPPYGDNPTDHEWIKKGFKYYDKR